MTRACCAPYVELNTVMLKEPRELYGMLADTLIDLGLT
jgi:hypothetical protein